MKIRKIAGTALIAGAMGVAGLGLGAGSAQADIWVPDIPEIPWGPGHWIPDVPNIVPGEGPTGLGAPGQLKKVCVDGVSDRAVRNSARSVDNTVRKGRHQLSPGGR